MRLIANIDGEDILEDADGMVYFIAKAAVDTDGVGPLHGDPCAQKETSLKPNLNADLDRYIVVPPAIIHGVKGVVLGCRAHVLNTVNGKETEAVVGDIGPRKKLGEVSVATAEALGLDPSPNHGGTDDHIIQYRIYPGVPAIVEGKIYDLQRS